MSGDGRGLYPFVEYVLPDPNGEEEPEVMLAIVLRWELDRAEVAIFGDVVQSGGIFTGRAEVSVFRVRGLPLVTDPTREPQEPYIRFTGDW